MDGLTWKDGVEGKVLLDGMNIYENMDVNSLRKRVGMVFQRPNPFPMMFMITQRMDPEHTE